MTTRKQCWRDKEVNNLAENFKSAPRRADQDPTQPVGRGGGPGHRVRVTHAGRSRGGDIAIRMQGCGCGCWTISSSSSKVRKMPCGQKIKGQSEWVREKGMHWEECRGKDCKILVITYFNNLLSCHHVILDTITTFNLIYPATFSFNHVKNFIFEICIRSGIFFLAVLYIASGKS